MAKLSNFVQALKLGAHLSAKVGTATGAASAATCHAVAGRVTTEALTTAAAGEVSYTITNNKVKSTDLVMVNVKNGTNTTVGVVGQVATISGGSFVVVFTNLHASAALNGTLVIDFVVIRPA